MAVLKFRNANGEFERLRSVKVDCLRDISDKVLISMEHGMVSFSGADSINGGLRVLVKRGSIVECVAEKIDGLFFNYMRDDTGKIVSYREKYDFVCYGDIGIVAVYSNEEVEGKNLTFFIGSGYYVDYMNKKLYVVFGREILSDYRVVKHGLLYTSKLLCDEEMVIGGEASDYITDKTTNVGDYYAMLNVSDSQLKNHTQRTFRAYSVIEKDGIEEVVYSDVIRVRI